MAACCSWLEFPFLQGRIWAVRGCTSKTGGSSTYCSYFRKWPQWTSWPRKSGELWRTNLILPLCLMSVNVLIALLLSISWELCANGSKWQCRFRLTELFGLYGFCMTLLGHKICISIYMLHHTSCLRGLCFFLVHIYVSIFSLGTELYSTQIFPICENESWLTTLQYVGRLLRIFGENEICLLKAYINTCGEMKGQKWFYKGLCFRRVKLIEFMCQFYHAIFKFLVSRNWWSRPWTLCSWKNQI